MRTSADDYSLAQRPRNQICHDLQAPGLSKPNAATIQKTDAMPERIIQYAALFKTIIEVTNKKLRSQHAPQWARLGQAMAWRIGLLDFGL
jgi:hypothetical protein